VKGTELVRKGLLPAHRYCLWVRATDPAGNKSERTQACATTPDLTPPTAPENLAAARRAATQVVVLWDASQDDVGVVAYDVLQGEEVVATATRTWTIVSGLAPERQHCFSVRARDAAGNRSKGVGPLCATTPAPSTPPGPVNLRVDAGVAGVRLRWEPSPQPGVVYAVYRDDDRRIGMTSSESYTLPGAVAGLRRCYRVAAVTDAGVESPKTLPACAPARLAATSR
jgi:chitodextrinase